MDKQTFGYKTYITLALAAALCWHSKTHAQDFTNSKDSIEVDNSKDKEFEVDSATVDFAALGDNYVSNQIQSEKEVYKLKEAERRNLDAAAKDSIFQEQIYQSILEIEPQLLRFMALSEDIKFVAYNDRTGRKITIANGLTRIAGRPVRRGDVIKSEEQMISETRNFFRQKIVPMIAKYLPKWPQFEKNEKIVLLDMFWNNGAGGNVLVNGPTKNAYCLTLSDAQKQEIADIIKNNDQKIVFEGQTYSLCDLPEYRNMNVDERTAVSPIYANKHIVKGTDVNMALGEKFGLLMDEERREVVDLLKQKVKFNEFSGPSLPNRFDTQHTNDSTIIYGNFLTQMLPYSYSEIRPYYLLSEEKQTIVTQKLAAANKVTNYNGHTVSAKDIQAWYFLSPKDQVTIKGIFKGMPLFKKNSKNQMTPILTGLCCELNLYLANKTPENRERAANRIASFVHSGEKIVPQLFKRANLRALIFSGKISLEDDSTTNESKTASINLDKIHLGAISSAKVSAFDNPKALTETLMNVKAGQSYKDTIAREEARVQKIVSRGRRNVQTKINFKNVRSGARGH